MEPQGKSMLKVVSILFIVFGAIATVCVLLISLIPILLGSMASQLGDAGDAVNAALTIGAPIIIIGLILALLGSVLELILGIVGLKKCGDPTQANFFIATGIVLCVLQLISMIMSFSLFSLIGFVLPILYIVGGTMNKKAVAPAA